MSRDNPPWPYCSGILLQITVKKVYITLHYLLKSGRKRDFRIGKMSWFLMNKKTDEKKKKDELKKFFQKAVSVESDGKLSKDQWVKVLTEAGIKKSP